MPDDIRSASAASGFVVSSTRDAMFCPGRKLAGKLHNLGLGNTAKIR
jgi:hypothetical protein